MRQYLDLLEDILTYGSPSEDRTGTGTIRVFGRQMRFDLSKGFPAITTKKIHLKSVIYELLWFMRGETNIKYLNDNGVTIWDEWADENGECGPIYGKQWRSWPAFKWVEGHAAGHEWVDERWSEYKIDQLSDVLNRIKTKPYDRRMIVSAWNVGELDQMSLPACHSFFQFFVDRGRLSCQMYQRSCDTFLGLPFNIASYALLIHIMANMASLEVGEFVWTGGDVHIYNNHIEQAKLQLTRPPRALPTLLINPKPKARFEDWDYDDFTLINYTPHPHIKGAVSV